MPGIATVIRQKVQKLRTVIDAQQRIRVTEFRTESVKPNKVAYLFG